MFGDTHSSLELSFSRVDVLKKVRENRAKHEKDYQDAIKQYRLDLVEELEKKLALAKEGKKVSHGINLAVPQSFLDEYDRAIEMLELATDQTLTMGVALFQQLMRDEWAWKNAWDTNTMSYANKARGVGGE